MADTNLAGFREQLAKTRVANVMAQGGSLMFGSVSVADSQKLSRPLQCG